MRRSPLDIVAALGLVGPGALSPEDVESLRERRRGFDWTHVGTHDLSIGALLRLIEESDDLCPPRSGHLGNWEDIAAGRAGAMDFNHAICARGWGYPLVYCFNQTEDASMTGGDWVYLPGSIARRGERAELPLFSWDGARLVRRDRTTPLFVPFVWTAIDGEMLPLIEAHWRRMQRLPFRFRLEASVIHERRLEIAPMLTVLLEEASARTNPRRAFADLVSHAAALDGTVARASVRRDGAAFWLDDVRFPTVEAFVQAALLPFEAVTEPQRFLDRLPKLPSKLPVLAGLLVGAFSAIFSTHYPGAKIDRATMTRPFNPHLHWGARDMAGYPPRRNGYFSERSTIKSMRQIFDALVARFAEVDPVYFVLLPSAVFMLCPADVHPGDGDALARLFQNVIAETSTFCGVTDDRMMTAIDRIVRQWLDAHEASLSPYLMNRFSARRGVLHDTEVPERSAPAEPDGFRALTVRQACMVVGALTEALRQPETHAEAEGTR